MSPSKRDQRSWPCPTISASWRMPALFYGLVPCKYFILCLFLAIGHLWDIQGYSMNRGVYISPLFKKKRNYQRSHRIYLDIFRTSKTTHLQQVYILNRGPPQFIATVRRINNPPHSKIWEDTIWKCLLGCTLQLDEETILVGLVL